MKKTIRVISPSPVPEDRYISQVQESIHLYEPITYYLMDGCLTIDVVQVVYIHRNNYF